MRRITIAVLVVAVLAAAGGCGGSGTPAAEAPPSTTAAPTTTTTTPTTAPPTTLPPTTAPPTTPAPTTTAPKVTVPGPTEADWEGWVAFLRNEMPKMGFPGTDPWTGRPWDIAGAKTLAVFLDNENSGNPLTNPAVCTDPEYMEDHGYGQSTTIQGNWRGIERVPAQLVAYMQLGLMSADYRCGEQAARWAAEGIVGKATDRPAVEQALMTLARYSMRGED